MKPTAYEIFDRTVNLAIRLQTMAENPEQGQAPEVAQQLHERAVKALEQARAMHYGLGGAELANAQNRIAKTSNLLKVYPKGVYSFR